MPSPPLQEMGARMGDLEAEHDYLLDREGVAGRLEGEGRVGVASRLEGEGRGGVASRLVGVRSRPNLCSLLPEPGPCGSQVT